jgi:hypothetical protein
MAKHHAEIVFSNCRAIPEYPTPTAEVVSFAVPVRAISRKTMLFIFVALYTKKQRGFTFVKVMYVTNL